MTLYDIEPEDFGKFVHWLDYQKIPGLLENSVPFDILQLARIWILGERFNVPSLQNKAAICIIHSAISMNQISRFKEFAALAYSH